MIAPKLPLLAGSAAMLALTACVDATTGQPNRTGTGALTGAAIGAAIGAATGDGSRKDEILIGAALGGAAGAVVGNILDKQAAELRQGFGNGQIDVINTGSELIVRMPQDILFATDSAVVAGGLRSDLGVLAANLNRYPNSIVEVQGHTDNVGAASYNQGLSQRRAQAVTDILIQSGVSPMRLRAVGYGETQPIASNLTPGGRQQNRRVQIVIRPTN
ncbi:OmpA family protein [Rhodobacteraceae bacterium CCMM004]|nr:OmpA family protein [Rhodobacteraceae bacterium CCMM004]